MKFKYNGPDKHKSQDLVIFGIMDKTEELKKNQILDVPDDNETLISMLDASGYFERVEKEVKETEVKETKPKTKPKTKQKKGAD